MHAKRLLERLIEIERAIGVEDPQTVRIMVMQAEEYLLDIQKSAANGSSLDGLSPLRLGHREGPFS